MKTLLCLLAMLGATLPGLAAEPLTGLPVVVVDEEHLQLGKETDPPPYQLAPSKGWVLDASKYKFALPAASEPLNSVQVLWEEGQYTAVWKPVDGRMTLDASTLKPVGEFKAFAGFASGQTIVLAIGHGRREGTQIAFKPVWVGIVEVK